MSHDFSLTPDSKGYKVYKIVPFDCVRFDSRETTFVMIQFMLRNTIIIVEMPISPTR